MAHERRVRRRSDWGPCEGRARSWQINTEAWVDGDGRDYLISVLTDNNPTEAYGIQTVNSVSSIVWDTLR
jgi:hypothetical protein